MPPAAMAGPDESRRRRAVIITAVVLGLLAAGVYLGYILTRIGP